MSIHLWIGSLLGVVDVVSLLIECMCFMYLKRYKRMCRGARIRAKINFKQVVRLDLHSKLVD